MSFRIMTYNIQHCHNHNFKTDRTAIDYDNALAPVMAKKPIIVGLNEVYSVQPNQPEILAGKLSYDYRFFKACRLGEQLDYGNAILSGVGFLSAEAIAIPDPVERK